MAGAIVQMVSIVCLSVILRQENLFRISIKDIYITMVKTTIMENIAWSWKKIICSINGEEASWKPSCPQ